MTSTIYVFVGPVARFFYTFSSIFLLATFLVIFYNLEKICTLNSTCGILLKLYTKRHDERESFVVSVCVSSLTMSATASTIFAPL